MADADLSARLGRLLNSERGLSTADIALACGAEPAAPAIAAHRVLLAAASEPLRALMELAGPPAASVAAAAAAAASADGAPLLDAAALVARLPRLVVHGVSAAALALLVRFIYTGAAPADPARAVEMLCAAEKFALPALRSAMEHLVPRALRDDNACDVMTAAAE